MEKILCLFVFCTVFASCSPRQSIKDNKDNLGIVGVWVLVEREPVSNLKQNEPSSMSLLQSDVVIISYDGDDYYSVRSVKNIGSDPKVGGDIVMKLDGKGVASSVVGSNFILLVDAYHILRFSSEKSPVSFDLEVKKHDSIINGNVKSSDWILGGEYKKIK